MTTSQDIGIVVAYANERGKQIWVRREKRYHGKNRGRPNYSNTSLLEDFV
jgi:hypothetical protein